MLKSKVGESLSALETELGVSLELSAFAILHIVMVLKVFRGLPCALGRMNAEKSLESIYQKAIIRTVTAMQCHFTIKWHCLSSCF